MSLVRSALSAPATLDIAAYDAIHPRLGDAVRERTSGEGCGGWYEAYDQAHAAVRSGRDPHPRYAVYLSEQSGLADRLTCSLSVILYALLSNRAYEYVWYGNHVLWESMQSPYIDWRAPPRNLTYGRIVRDGTGGQVLPVVTENHFWAKPNRSELTMPFYLHPADEEARELMRRVFAGSDMVSGGALYDVVMWESNSGMLRWMTANPWLSARLQALNLSLPNAVRCLFNFAYVPSPAALAPWRGSPILDKLLDPAALIIGIQIRVGDRSFNASTDNTTAVLAIAANYFACAQQLAEQARASPGFESWPTKRWGPISRLQDSIRAFTTEQQPHHTPQLHPHQHQHHMQRGSSSGGHHTSGSGWGRPGRGGGGGGGGASHRSRRRRDRGSALASEEAAALRGGWRRRAVEEAGAAGAEAPGVGGSAVAEARLVGQGQGQRSVGGGGRSMAQAQPGNTTAAGSAAAAGATAGVGEPALGLGVAAGATATATTTPTAAAAGAREVYFFLVTDSAALRKAAQQAFGGGGRLLLAEDIILDHVQDQSHHGQAGLHAAASELWLFGQAHIHVVTVKSAYGRLGALAGARTPRVYGVGFHAPRECWLDRPDPVSQMVHWSVGMRRRRAAERRST
ncbi:hypothetical protein HYH03_015209 [Edaphochlamys debaryana]|uniref:Uncharacterized protein n=1 Tax=Edaphochlamys debaryana TaxID=47281 RepID=A0A836BSR7_9CHLO|nr:hypothetical protein HYH03_015209 [Edaphochlamys debaryana]|eukprot:KAG2486114.1 hypothetical protein HYH03_015209 [Edaphochlamys debaryana]